MGRNLYHKVFDSHTVQRLPSGQYQLLIGLHLIHEVTSPQAFAMLRERGIGVLYPNRTFATIDHIVPTHSQARPYLDPLAEQMVATLEKNVSEHGITYFDIASGHQGIVHVIGPETGLTQPGTTICCGDSHTSTHGAFGALAFGIGTTQLRDVLATQTLAVDKLKVRRIEVNGRLRPGVYAKDVILTIIHKLGVKGGIGFAYEYGGEVFDNFSVEERMTVCNMSIEGGARVGYVNPDQKVYEYLRGRPYAPGEAAWERALAYWESIRSDPDAEYDEVVTLAGEEIEPVVTWGITPAQSVPVGAELPRLETAGEDRDLVAEAFDYMDFKPGSAIRGAKIDVAFIGSCANGRLSDIEEVVHLVEADRSRKVASHVNAYIVPGSQKVRAAMAEKGYDRLLQEAGFLVQNAGCSMCIGMNPDKLIGHQVCASSSTRNFKGRQGSPRGRTLLMSPAMVAAAALAGEVVDVRDWLPRTAVAATQEAGGVS